MSFRFQIRKPCVIGAEYKQPGDIVTVDSIEKASFTGGWVPLDDDGDPMFVTKDGTELALEKQDKAESIKAGAPVKVDFDAADLEPDAEKPKAKAKAKGTVKAKAPSDDDGKSSTPV
jgi:hypothetical protein